MQYHYVAYNLDEGIVKGRVEARNTEEAEAEVSRLGYNSLQITKSLRMPSAEKMFPSIYKVGNGELINFCRHMATMVSNGANLQQSLVMLQSETRNRAMRKTLISIAKAVDEGSTLSAAMSEHPTVFNEMFVNLVQVGELTGDITPALNQLGDSMAQSAEAKGRIMKALMLPAINLLLAGVMLIITMTVIMPKILSNFDDVDVPLMMRLANGGIEAIKANWIALGIGIIVIAISISLLLRIHKVKYRFDYYKTKIPVVGHLLVFNEMARFSSAVAMLMNSGITLADALNLGVRGTGNVAIKTAFADAEDNLISGESFADTLKRHPVLPHMWVELVVVGEQTNSLGKTLTGLAKSYSDMVESKVTNLVAVLDPITTVAVGAVVMFIALSNIQIIQSSMSALTD